jgi:hypothetical protein
MRVGGGVKEVDLSGGSTPSIHNAAITKVPQDIFPL